MVTQFMQVDAQQEGKRSVGGGTFLFTAVFLGLLLAAGGMTLFSGLSGWGVLGIGVLGMGSAWVLVALVSQRVYKQVQWGMVVAGQLMGAVAILLLLWASI